MIPPTRRSEWTCSKAVKAVKAVEAVKAVRVARRVRLRGASDGREVSESV
jgi:hypothetical protein